MVFPTNPLIATWPLAPRVSVSDPPAALVAPSSEMSALVEFTVTFAAIVTDFRVVMVPVAVRSPCRRRGALEEVKAPVTVTPLKVANPVLRRLMAESNAAARANVRE